MAKDSRRAAPQICPGPPAPGANLQPHSPSTHAPGEGRRGHGPGNGVQCTGMICHGSGRVTPIYRGALAAGSPYTLPGCLKVSEAGCPRSPKTPRESRQKGEAKAGRGRGATGKRQVTEDAFSWACRVRAPHPGTRVYIPEGGLHSRTGARELELMGRRGNDGDGEAGGPIAPRALSDNPGTTTSVLRTRF